MFDGVGMESERKSWNGLFIPTMVCDDGIWGLEGGRGGEMGERQKVTSRNMTELSKCMT